MAETTDPRPPLDRDRLAMVAHHEIVVMDEVGSTNAEAADWARAGAAEHLVVVAERQLAGRGRLDRRWLSPPGAGLTFSVLWRPEGDVRRWSLLPLLAGVAVASVVERWAPPGADVALKWPNDVLLGGRKVAGILVERVETRTRPVAVVGVGLNVSAAAEELPGPEATSLALAGIAIDRTDLLVELLAELRTEYAGWPAAAGLIDRYTELCPTVRGARVRVELPAGETLEGTGRGLDEAGGLLVETGEGIRAVHAGDVIHVRPQ